MINALLLLFAGVLAVYWAVDTVNEIERYEENDDYEAYGMHRFWLAVCLIWTPFAVIFGPFLINALIMIPMTVRWSVTFYYEELR